MYTFVERFISYLVKEGLSSYIVEIKRPLISGKKSSNIKNPLTVIIVFNVLWYRCTIHFGNQLLRLASHGHAD